MPQFDDKALLTDALESQKKIATDYITATTETSSQALRQDLMNLCNEEVGLQKQIYDLMTSKGYYTVQNAPPQQIQQASQKFQQALQQLQ